MADRNDLSRLVALTSGLYTTSMIWKSLIRASWTRPDGFYCRFGTISLRGTRLSLDFSKSVGYWV